MLWEQAVIALPITDARYVREPIVLASGNGTAAFEAGGARVPGFGPLLVAPYAALGLGPITAPQAFSFELALGGTGAVKFLPLGDETRVVVASGWPSPSFVGAFLPSERTVDTSGFTAEWRVLDLGRGYPSSWNARAARRRVSSSRVSAPSSSRLSASTKRRCVQRSTAC
jgi:inner membrane protein